MWTSLIFSGNKLNLFAVATIVAAAAVVAVVVVAALALALVDGVLLYSCCS